MRASGIVGWGLGALTALVIVALASVLAPAPQVGPGPQAVAEAPQAPDAGAGAGEDASLPAPDAQPPLSADSAPALAPPASDAAPAPGTEPSPPVPDSQTAAPSAPARSDAPAATAAETPPDAAAPAPTQDAGAAETAPSGEAAATPDLPVVDANPPETPPAAAASADQPQSPAAPDGAPQVAVAAAALAVPASDASPAAEPAPQHDTLLEPAPVPATAPDAGEAPAGANLPQVPAGGADKAATALPQVLPPASSDAPDAAPKAGMTATIQDVKPSTLPGVGRLTDQAAEPAPGASAGLPQIGKDDGGAGSLPQIGTSDAAAALAAPQGPLQLFAREFTPADPPKPLFAILLRDVGDRGMRREDLLRLPFPVSIVLDPLAADANEAMQAWRGAGQEVVMAMGGLPEGATASDVAQTFQALATSLPQAVAVIDANGATFQNDRPLASLVVPEVQDAGLGLVTFDEGLDAADQIARRSGVPSVQIFRRLDATGEGKTVIRRYLDRAVFKAAQDGLVVVIGDTSADTVAAILEWTVEGKASGVTLAPLTAVLGR